MRRIGRFLVLLLPLLLITACEKDPELDPEEDRGVITDEAFLAAAIKDGVDTNGNGHQAMAFRQPYPGYDGN